MTKTAKTSSMGDKPTSTSKKQRFITGRELIDPKTGEVIPTQEVAIEDRDFNFHKFWLRNIVQSLDGIANQRLRLAFWIIDHLDSENKLVATQRAIAEQTGMGVATVARTMTALQAGETPFLQRINSGAYRVNPNVVWRGAYGKRMAICYEWSATAIANDHATETATATAQKNDAAAGA